MTELQRIACVDDEPVILELVKLSLETVGHFTVSVYSDAKEALCALPEEPPDLILLDGMMPGMSGMQFIQEIKTNDKLSQIPVVFMTARIRPEEKKEYLGLGAAGVIEKPFDPMILPQVIAEMWNNASQK